MAPLLHQSFADLAHRCPDLIAIDVPPGKGRPARETITYAALDAAADRLAATLRPLVHGECIVAIRIPRNSPRLYLAQLAVLKAGAAFTCIDPAFPEERVREILEDSQAIAILEPDSSGGIAVTRVPHDRVEATDPAPFEPAPDTLAYVIYTSGTTGRPKGVMIEHRSIANLVASDRAEFALGPNDRVIQGSSAAYDSSLEEIWLAFAAGATLLVMDDTAARLGPDLTAWLRRERATVFCPPPTLLRSMGCADPLAALPDLRLLYVGGEALPADIAAAWSRGRRMVNGYGPTECTVTCLRADVVAGAEVAIGTPVSGSLALVLGEDGAEVPAGEKGELHMGGACLARGYWRNPELTAEKFIHHPQFGRLYRTGDLVHRDAAGNIFYHGRIDAQIKLRGYRIELGEIEARLVEYAGVRAAACRVQEQDGAAFLTGFVVAEDPAAPPDPASLREALAAVLPGYMVPRQIALIDQLPTTIGGKLDRARLPALAFGEALPGDAGVAPRTPLERKLEAAVRDILRHPGGVSVTADFFDLGGDSLSAALLVTLLRDDPETEWVSVSDIYEARTIAELAQRAGSGAAPAPLEPALPGPRPGQRPLLVTLAQAGWVVMLTVLASWGGWLVSFELFPRLVGGLGMTAFILLAPLFGMVGLAGYTALTAALAVVVKRLVIGRYTPLRAPIWGSTYLRYWIVQQTVRLVPWRLIEGTSAQQAILRALGARIGRRVHIHRGVQLWRGGWDLLEIGDDVTISQEAMLRLTELDRGEIVIGPITIGARATLETRAGLAGHTVVGADACLSALSALPAHTVIGPGELWDGVPARCTGQAPPRPALTGKGREYAPALHGLALLAAEALIGAVVALPGELALIAAIRAGGLDAAGFWRWLYHPTANAALWTLLIAATILAGPVTLAWSASIARWLGPVQPGVISRWSLGYIRVWLKTGLLIAASEWLSGTLFWPWWLRRAGMRIGPDSEISTILDVVPELVSIGGGTFFADGIYLGGPRIQHGTVTLAATSLGANSFLGNHAVIRAGQHLPGDILIGISTPADAAVIRQGSSWFGHPLFELPRREVVEVDRSLTHEPSWLRYADRVFWEALRFALPVGPLLTLIGWFVAVERAAQTAPEWQFFALWLPLATFAAAASLCLAVLLLKWALLGRVKPGQHPLWSCWCSRWDFLYVAWGKWARPTLELLEGSLLLVAYLRGIGMKIGKRVALGPGFAQVVDPDMITLGDDATVNAIFQAHTFEDRVLKIDHVTIGAGATIGAATVPLYGAAVGEHCWVGPHSVIMKQEHLLPRRRYQGAPARP